MPKLDFRQIQQALGAVLTLITLISAIAGLSNQLGLSTSSDSTGSSAIGNSAGLGNRAVKVTQQELIDATNRYRAKHGLAPLEPLPELNAFAQEWAESMAQNLNHKHRADMTVPSRPELMVGENILRCQTTSNADALLRIWINSPGHNANMLKPDYKYIGVGIADNGTSRFAVQNFAY